MNLVTGASELPAEDIVHIIDTGDCIPIPNGVWEETVLVNVSSTSSIWDLKCHWMLIPTAPIWVLIVSQCLLALPFRPLNSNYEFTTFASVPECLSYFLFQSCTFQSQT